MKLALAARYDPWDVHRGSGTTHFLCHELCAQGHELLAMAVPAVPRPLLTRLLVRCSRACGWGYRVHQDPRVGRRDGQALGAVLANHAWDVLLTNDHAIAAYTPTAKPVVLYTDAMFPRRYRDNVHPWLAGLAPWSVRFSQKVNGAALARAELCCFASHWAAEQALAYPQADPQRISVIPFGANLAQPPPAALAADRQLDGTLELLWVGRDWQLKGGSVAVAALQELVRRGIRARLHLVGVGLPATVLPDDVVQHGVIDKAEPAGRQLLDQLYRQSHVLLLPTRAEGFGIAFAEAAAYGLPALAYATTGVKTAVADGLSGVLLPPGTGATRFADVLAAWVAAPEEYRHLALGARQHFESTVNWSTAVTRLIHAIRTLHPVP